MTIFLKVETIEESKQYNYSYSNKNLKFWQRQKQIQAMI